MLYHIALYFGGTQISQIGHPEVFHEARGQVKGEEYRTLVSRAKV